MLLLVQVMDAGVVVEQGTHQELVATGGNYAHMWDLQKSEGTKKMLKVWFHARLVGNLDCSVSTNTLLFANAENIFIWI